MIIVSVVSIIIILGIYWTVYTRKEKHNSKMSFKESIDLAELPIVTFYQNDKKFNFLLDTGSNYSHISKKAVALIKGEIIEAKAEVAGIGKSTTSGICKTSLNYKGAEYNIDLNIGEHLDSAFACIKSETGVTVHGILGNQFFQKYKYILDFNKLVAYSKK